MRPAKEWAEEAEYCARIHMTKEQKVQSLTGLIRKIQAQALAEAAHIAQSRYYSGGLNIHDAILDKAQEVSKCNQSE